MSQPENHPPNSRKPLVTVQHESERDLRSGAVEKRMFVKMYTDVRTSGLFEAMPDELWKTLCLLATYMDEEGNCWPGQSELSRHLRIRREAVGARIKRLVEFRFEGQPVISIRRIRTPKGHKRNEYHIYPISSLAIFDNPAPAKHAELSAGKSMSGSPHVAAAEPRSGRANVGSANVVPANLGPAHTNQIQVFNQKDLHTHTSEPGSPAVCISPKQAKERARSLVLEFHEQVGHPEATFPTDKELRFAERLILAFGEARARHVLAYGIEEARKTHFRARFFQGYEQYVTEALQDFSEHQAREAQRKRSQAHREAQERRAQEEAAEFFAKPLEERVGRALQTWIRTMETLRKRRPTDREIAGKRTWLREVQQRQEAEWREQVRQRASLQARVEEGDAAPPSAIAPRQPNGNTGGISSPPPT